MTASAEQLQLMLYDGCIRFATQARDAIEKKDYATSYDRLTRARNIITEMRQGLNFDANPELCDRVAAIYGFLYHKLLEAKINRIIPDIDDALRVLQIERETWQILVDKVNRARESGHGDAGATPGIESSPAQAQQSYGAVPGPSGGDIAPQEGFSVEC